jgi:ribosomal protein S18 acetylase RimI-like enzyme
MARETITFDLERFRSEAWSVGNDVKVESLTPDRVQDLLEFLAQEFPGDWTTAARPKLRGRMHELLIARRGDKVVGYCQWDGEHFGPFGVAASERNAKLGAKLFVEAVRRIRANDGRTVWFNWADPDAQRFYDRYGFKPTRRFAIMHRTA